MTPPEPTAEPTARAARPAPTDSSRLPAPSLRLVLGYGLPSTVGIMALHGMDLVDMFWVSRLGPEAVAAIALFLPVYMIYMSVNGFVGTGSVTLISRAFGRGDLPATADMIRQNFYAKFILGTAAGLIGFVSLGWSLERLGAEPGVTAMSAAYGRVILPALGVTLGKFTCFTAFRCAGRPRLAMYVMLAAVALNLVLDPFLIFGWGPFPRLGLPGAALASVIASSAILVVCLVLLARGIVGHPVDWRRRPPFDRRTLRILARVGIPAGANNLLRALAATVIMAMVTPFGTTTVAVFGVASRIMRLGVELSGGFGLGLASLVGQALGAGRPDEARQCARRALAVVGTTLVALSVGLAAGARPVSALFFEQGAVIAESMVAMRILLLATPLLGMALILNGVFSGAGYTLLPTLVRQGVTWLVQVPLIGILVSAVGAPAVWVWWSLVGGAVLALAGDLWLYRRHGWESWMTAMTTAIDDVGSAARARRHPPGGRITLTGRMDECDG
jgi:putative MATE family efflux protein